MDRDWGSKPGGGGAASAQNEAIDRRERLRRLALETIDLAKDPYFMRNHLGSYECKLCLTLHNNEGNYLAHTQGKRHQTNLAKRAAREAKESPALPQPHKRKVNLRKSDPSLENHSFPGPPTALPLFNCCEPSAIENIVSGHMDESEYGPYVSQNESGYNRATSFDSLLLESNDFDFCISESFEQDSSCAEELFSDGKILPLEIKKQVLPPKPPTHPTSNENSKKESLKEIMEQSFKTEEKPTSSSSSTKSFWRFKRSSSCGNGYKRSLICSLPLLSRSNSTGSAPTPKRSSSLKDNHNKHLPKTPSSNGYTKSALSSSSSYPYSTPQKPSQKKNYGSYNNGVRISPLLNPCLAASYNCTTLDPPIHFKFMEINDF
ncbi:hypothetical protein IFM89_009861 [Coptis chinensis]|uniref:Matrin-type domain-containing protein n=1 Tax=Coptis chinensis TaxID=261450 RepID=A0A835HWZ4_9MAGN|nr:hypothetical protein IFM89_009861 [Coptis chinensis]